MSEIRIKLLHKNLIRTAVIAGLILLLLILAFIYVNGIKSDFANEKLKIERQHNALVNNINQTNKSLRNLEKNLDIYEAIPVHKQSDLGGLEYPSSRIRSIRPVFEKLSKEYHLKNTELTLGQIKKLEFKKSRNRRDKNPIPELKVNSAYYGSVDLSFTAVNDIYALAFCMELEKTLPGLVMIERLELNRQKNDAGGQILAQIRLGWYSVKMPNRGDS